MRDIFSTGRYEHNRPYRHIFYLPKNIYDRLIGPKPVYLFGGRGSGKTSLLKLLDWNERCQNKSLIECYDGNPFGDRILGIYLKLPKEHLGSLDRWLSEYSNDQAAGVFGLYLDLLWVEELFKALFELASRDTISLTVSAQSNIFKKLNEDPAFAFLRKGQDLTPIRLFEGIRAAREQLKQMAFLRKSLEEFLSVFPLLEPGGFGRKLSNLLLAEDFDSPLKDWSIKICFDEGEALSKQQQICVNSATRHTESPICYIFAFVSSARDLTTTLWENLSVNLSDCEPVELDKTSLPEFCALVQGVATARARALVPSCQLAVSLEAIFGKFTINELLEHVLRPSVSKQVRDLLDESAKLQHEPFFAQGETGEEEVFEGVLPIYQTYLIRKGVASLPRPESAEWEKRAQESAELRKRMVAAYLSICAELNIEPLYAGWRVAVSLADNSVRDMLFELDQIYIRRNRDLEAMLHSPLGVREQNSALCQASELKLRALPEWVRIPHEKVKGYVEVFGALTYSLQSKSPDLKHLRSSERGTFVVDLGIYQSNRFAEHRKIIEEAIYAGYFVEQSVGDEQFAFRLHRSLAPYFKTSYRGSYYPVYLTFSDFEKASENLSARSGQEIADSIASRFQEDRSQLFLFEA